MFQHNSDPKHTVKSTIVLKEEESENHCLAKYFTWFEHRWVILKQKVEHNPSSKEELKRIICGEYEDLSICATFV